MIRRLSIVLAVFAAALSACTPPPAPTPTAVASLGLVGTPDGRSSFVSVAVSTTNFEAQPAGAPLSVAVKLFDASTGAVVDQRTVDVYEAGSNLLVAAPISGFRPDTSTLDGRIHARVELTVTQATSSGGLTASDDDERVLDWTMATSPYDGLLTPHDPPNYQLVDILPAFCGPLGRTIHVVSPDTPDPMTITQAIPGNSLSNPVTIPAGGGDVTFQTVTECVVLAVYRVSFTGGITGEAHFTVEF